MGRKGRNKTGKFGINFGGRGVNFDLSEIVWEYEVGRVMWVNVGPVSASLHLAVSSNFTARTYIRSSLNNLVKA